MQTYSIISSENWIANGGIANNGMAYGPAVSAFSYGTPGCPLAPRLYRKEMGKTPLPTGLCYSLGRPRLTVADLGSDVWRSLADREFPLELQQEIMAFLYQLPVPKKGMVLPSGIAIPWLLAIPVSQRLRNALHRHFSNNSQSEFLYTSMDCEEFLAVRGCGNTALLELLCVLESAELGIVSEHTEPHNISTFRTMSEAQFQTAIQEAVRKALNVTNSIGNHL